MMVVSDDPSAAEGETMSQTNKSVTVDQVPVSRRALTQRIDRVLAPAGRKLVKSRGERARIDVGEYYVLDTNANTIVWKQFDLEAYARSLGALHPWERLAEETV